MKLATRIPSVCLGLLIAACSTTRSDSLPPEGAASWEIHGMEEYVTFVLFDPAASGIELPHSLRWMRADEAPMPFVKEYVASHPEVAGFAFSFIEITKQSQFVVDGRSPELPENGGIALWFAPVDASAFVAKTSGSALATAIQGSEGSVVGLGIWMQDRQFVDYLRELGHHAEYGEVTLVDDGTGRARGLLRTDELTIDLSALPHGDSMTEDVAATQILFSSQLGPSRALVISAANPTHRECQADWSLTGRHPLGRAVRVGPTFRTTYPAALTGRAYAVR